MLAPLTQNITATRGLLGALHPVRRNIILINLFVVFQNGIFILPILMPYYESIGLTFQQFLIGEAIFATTMIVMEVPSGWIADVWKRKNTIALGTFVDALGVLILMLADSFWMAVLSQAVIGVGLSLTSGTVSAMLYDTLAEVRLQSKFRKLEGFRHALGMYAVAIAALAGGFLYQIDRHLPFWFDLTGLALAILCISFATEPRRIKEAVQGNALRDIYETVKFALHGHKEIACIIFFMAVLFGITQVGFWTQQPYYMALGINEAWFGIFTATGALLAGLAGHYGHLLENKIRGEGRVLIIIWLVVTMGYLLSGITLGYHGVVLLFCSSLSYGLTFPIIQDAINRRVASSRRATILSAANLSKSLLFIPVSFVIGGIADESGITTALLALAVTLFVGGSAGLLCLKRCDVIK